MKDDEEKKVITFENIPDKIILDDKFTFNVLMTLGLYESGDFYIRIDFKDLDEETFKKIVMLQNIPQAKKIQSELITKEDYNIKYIVVFKMSSQNNPLSIYWECLSDDPDSYHYITQKNSD